MSDDLISRDAVLKQISYWIGSGEYRYAMPERFLIDRIITLSSVKPQEPKTGHWIEIAQYSDGNHKIECSECGSHIFDRGHANSFNVKNKYKYCPNCGARMAESEESIKINGD